MPLVILYILKVKRRRRAVGSTWLWAAARRDLMAKSPFKRLIAQVPLIIQALALLALGFAPRPTQVEVGSPGAPRPTAGRAAARSARRRLPRRAPPDPG